MRFLRVAHVGVKMENAPMRTDIAISFSHYKDTINNVTTKAFHRFYS